MYPLFRYRVNVARRARHRSHVVHRGARRSRVQRPSSSLPCRTESPGHSVTLFCFVAVHTLRSLYTRLSSLSLLGENGSARARAHTLSSFSQSRSPLAGSLPEWRYKLYAPSLARSLAPCTQVRNVRILGNVYAAFRRCHFRFIDGF